MCLMGWINLLIHQNNLKWCMAEKFMGYLHLYVEMERANHKKSQVSEIKLNK